MLASNQSHKRAPERVAGPLVLGAISACVLWSVVAAKHSGAPQPTRAEAAAAGGGAAITGIATFYADDFNGRPMADGVPFNMDDPTTTAANAWPLGTRLRLRRLPGSPWDATLTAAERARFFNRSIEVIVRDRGAFTHALDLSRAAFAQLGRPDEGLIHVSIEPEGAVKH
jgi:rare lipoprotein A (peptidoglycan hydrolase)